MPRTRHLALGLASLAFAVAPPAGAVQREVVLEFTGTVVASCFECPSGGQATMWGSATGVLLDGTRPVFLSDSMYAEFETSTTPDLCTVLNQSQWGTFSAAGLTGRLGILRSGGVGIVTLDEVNGRGLVDASGVGVITLAFTDPVRYATTFCQREPNEAIAFGTVVIR